MENEPELIILSPEESLCRFIKNDLQCLAYQLCKNKTVPQYLEKEASIARNKWYYLSELASGFSLWQLGGYINCQGMRIAIWFKIGVMQLQQFWTQPIQLSLQRQIVELIQELKLKSLRYILGQRDQCSQICDSC
jgi:hypothetical protein